jgi:hypothetical protein
MKKILLTTTLLISTTLLFSQTKYGVKAGVNFASVNIQREQSNLEGETSSQTSFHIGGFAEMGITSKFYFQPGLTLSGKGYKIKGSKSETVYTLSETESINLMYLEVPLTFLTKFSIGPSRFSLGAGPYLGYGISGKQKVTLKFDAPGSDEDASSSESADLKFGSKTGEVKPFDFGLNLSAGYEIKSGIFVNAGYGFGLNNITNKEDTKVKNKVVSISLGYKF